MQKRKFNILANAAAIFILAAVVVPAWLLLRRDILMGTNPRWQLPLTILAMFLYVFLHEMTHALAYKVLTGEKLVFGITLTTAYCGVPHIFVYRKAALIAVLAPFVVFTVLLSALFLLVSHPYTKLLTAVLLGLHWGGCTGDLYDALIFLTKLRSPKTLMQDTGPRQTFYLYESGEKGM